MRRFSSLIRGVIVLVLLGCGSSLSTPARATSLAAHPLSGETGAQETPKNEMVKNYVAACRTKPVKQAECDKVKQSAIDLLKEDLRTLGSSADSTYLPTILSLFKSDEPDLRIAAADAAGMIGPPESSLDRLTPVINDPVPDVRKAASQMLQHGKGETLALLARRTATSLRSGKTPEARPDPKKYGMPLVPDSTFLFFASDISQGRLGYITNKPMKETLTFFKQQAKKGPLELEAFNRMYDRALQDEQQAREQAQQETAANLFSQPPPTDPSDMEAYLKQLEQAQNVMAAQSAFMLEELYPPDMFGSPKVLVLEEKKIGKRNYPVRYVVLYEDLALKRPGFRLCWMTVSDQAILTAQMTAMMGEALENRASEEEERVSPLKEKSEKERKTFKQEQLDLEKQLGL